MAGQQLRLTGDGQLCKLAQALLHLAVIAALQVGASHAALKDCVPGKEVLAAEQHHAALCVAGGVPDRELELIHGDGLPLLIAAVHIGCFQGKQLGAAAVNRLTVEPGLMLPAEGACTAHMVIVAVGAEDGGELRVVLF